MGAAEILTSFHYIRGTELDTRGTRVAEILFCALEEAGVKLEHLHLNYHWDPRPNRHHPLRIEHRSPYTFANICDDLGFWGQCDAQPLNRYASANGLTGSGPTDRTMNSTVFDHLRTIEFSRVFVEDRCSLIIFLQTVCQHAKHLESLVIGTMAAAGNFCEISTHPPHLTLDAVLKMPCSLPTAPISHHDVQRIFRDASLLLRDRFIFP